MSPAPLTGSDHGGQGKEQSRLNFQRVVPGQPIGSRLLCVHSSRFELILDTMLQNEPGSLSPEDVVALIADNLSGNRVPAGDAGLTSEVEGTEGEPLGAHKPGDLATV